MMTPEEKAEHAYENDALSELFMGEWPYHEPEAYRAPSNVPTNWQEILGGLSNVAERFPDLSPRVNQALQAMTSSAEGAYSALEVVLGYLDTRAFLSPKLDLDYAATANAIRRQLPVLEKQARGLHLPWMGPTAETLWERIQRIGQVLQQAHGIQVL
jgi:hypothetical protein